jgi:thiamine-phosphate pyrophosphorylase
MLVTSPEPSCGQPLEDVVRDCLAAGATAIQLRDKDASARELAATARVLRPIVRRAGGLLIINDRLDVALAVAADGVHLGPQDLPVAAARAIVPDGFLIGHSCDAPDPGRRAADDGADYLGVGAVYGTRSKAGLADEAIGPERVGEVLAAASLPGVGIGGIGPANAAPVFAAGAGVAVISAVMDADDPATAVRAILGAGTTA